MKNDYRMNWKWILKRLLFLALFLGIPAAVSFADVTLTSPVVGNHQFTDNTTIQLTNPPAANTGVLDVSTGQTITANGPWNITIPLPTNAPALYNNYGVYARNGGAVNLGSNKVTVSSYGTALMASGTGANRGQITLGDNAVLHGLVGGGYAGTVHANNGDIFIGNNALITNDGANTTVYDAHKGVFAYEDGTVTIGENVVIETSGNWRYNHGVQAGNVLIQDGRSTTGHITLGDNATISTQGESSYGLTAQADGSTITAGTVNITTSGYRAFGIYADGFISGITTGLPVITTAAATIVTSGDEAHGVGSAGGGTVYLGANSDIKTSGTGAAGALSWYGSPIYIGSGTTISTTGVSEAAGLYAFQGGSIHAEDGVSITTTGRQSDGIFVWRGGEITFGDITISTTGYMANAINASALVDYNLGEPVDEGNSVIRGTGVMDITGSIYAENYDDPTYTAIIQLQMNNGSRFTGDTWRGGGNSWDTVLDLTILGSDSRWTMTASSWMSRFGMGERFRHTIPAGRTIYSSIVEVWDGAALTINGGLTVYDTLSGKVGQTSIGRTNLYGSHAGDTDIYRFGLANSATKLEPHSYIDSTSLGVKAYNITSGGTAYLDSLNIDAAVWGFAQLNSNKYVLIDATAGSLNGTANVYHPSLAGYEVRQQGNQVYLEFNESWSDHVWTDLTQRYYYTDGSEADMLKIIGSYDISKFHIGFLNLDDALAPLLRDYLNQGMEGSLLRFSLCDEDSLWLGGGDYLNPDGYVLFGWDLRDFNEMYGTNVLLEYWDAARGGGGDVPEPATWAMMGLGGTIFGCGYLRRKRK